MSPLSPLPMEVSLEQKRVYEQLAATLVNQAVGDFAALSASECPGVGQRHVDAGKWKAFKKHETVQIYRSRERAQTGTKLHDPLIEWEPMAKLLCVGTLLGTLDDVMYGAITPTELAMATRSLYIQDEFNQHRVLHVMRSPTREAPFEYLGIKWVARAPSVAALVKPRESLYLEATGCRDVEFPRGDSERIGFVVYHSIERPELLQGNGMVHARVSASYIFRETAPGVVELYATMTTDAGGHLPTKLAALAGATVMIAVSRVTECALKKKLAWMLSRRSRSYTDNREEEPTSSCVQCSRSLSSFRSLTVCSICGTRVCSRCITSRRLLVGRTKASLKRKSVAMCKSCIATAKNNLSSADVAASEFARHNLSRGRLPSTTPSNASSEESYPQSSRSVLATQSIHEDHVTPTGPTIVKIAEADTTDEQPEDAPAIADDNVQTPPAQSAAQQAPSPNDKIEWWMRINELRLQAEETYQLAKEQTITMQQVVASRSSN